MAKQRKTYSEKIIAEKDGLMTVAWKKRCLICGTTYVTFSRHQAYCSPECSKKAQTKKYKYRKSYDAEKSYIRLSSRSHAIGTEVLSLLEHEGIIEHKCAECGTTENLECHHINADPLNNSASNLQWLCTKCHHNVHTKVSGEIHIRGIYKELYKHICK